MMIQPLCSDLKCVRRLIGVFVIGALVCGAAAQAEWGKTTQLHGERAAAHDASRSSESRASQRVQPAAPIALDNGFVEFVPSAKVVLHAQGGVAGPPPAVVFSNTIFGNGLFDPDGDLGSGIFFLPSRDDAVAQGGWWVADDWVLQIGTGMSECIGTTLQIAVFGGGRRCFDAMEWNPCSVDSDCSDNNCQDAGPFDATVDVFNHDPSFANDDLMDANNTCLATDPGVGAHSTTFTDLDGLEIHVLEIDLGNTAIGGVNGAIWVRVQTTTGSSGWVLGSNGETAAPMPPDDAEIGFSADLIVLNDPSDGACVGYAFGTPQASMWGNLLCESAIAVSLQPAFATGVECPNGAADDPASCDWYIDGPNSIVLHRPGQDISSELFLSDWDQGGVSGLVIWVADTSVDCATFASGKEGTFRAVPGTSCPGGDFGLICNGVDQNRPDYIFVDADSVISGCNDQNLCADGLPGFVLCGSIVISIGAAGLDTGTPVYGNTYGFTDEDGNARGTFLLGISPDPNSTYVRDSMADLVAPISRIPMQVTVQTGACCGTPGNSFCETVLFDECAALGGNFLPGSECTGVDTCGNGQDDACPTCDQNVPDDVECDDSNACTDDDCQLCGCFNTDITTPGFCCNPAGGAETQIDDGDPCTIDTCNPVTGQVIHTVDPGASCDDGNACTFDDMCLADATCLGTDIHIAPCVTIDDCPSVAVLCFDGFCSCGDFFVCCGAGVGTLGCTNFVDKLQCQALGGVVIETDGFPCTGIDSDGDGVDDACPAAVPPVPAVSSWGLLILGLLLASAAKLYGLYGTPNRRIRAVVNA